MLRKLLSAAALAVAVTMTPAAVQPAGAVPAVKPDVGKASLKIDVRSRRGFRRGVIGPLGTFHARRGGLRRFRGGGVRRFRGGGIRPFRGVRRFHRGRGFGRRFHKRRRFRPHVYYGAPVYYYSYKRRCRWLKRRAIFTGSYYWWSRYRACRRGYY